MTSSTEFKTNILNAFKVIEDNLEVISKGMGDNLNNISKDLNKLPFEPKARKAYLTSVAQRIEDAQKGHADTQTLCNTLNKRCLALQGRVIALNEKVNDKSSSLQKLAEMCKKAQSCASRALNSLYFYSYRGFINFFKGIYNFSVTGVSAAVSRARA